MMQYYVQVSKKELASFGMQIIREFHRGNLNVPIGLGMQRIEREPWFSNTPI